MTERRRFIIARLAKGKAKRLCEAPTHTCKSKIRESMPHLVILSETQCSEVSKSSEHNLAQKAITKEQINESHRFAKSQQIANDSKVAKMDSSPTAQNDEFCKDSSLRGSFSNSENNEAIYESQSGLPRFGIAESRNDG